MDEPLVHFSTNQPLFLKKKTNDWYLDLNFGLKDLGIQASFSVVRALTGAALVVLRKLQGCSLQRSSGFNDT